MQTKEEKICTFTQKGTRLQLVKLIETTPQNTVIEIINTGGGYIKIYNNGERIKIKDENVEYEADIWGLTKDNENHYYKTQEELEKYAYRKIKYQVRLNRKIISSSISEYNERKVFATYAQNIVLQLKVY